MKSFKEGARQTAAKVHIKILFKEKTRFCNCFFCAKMKLPLNGQSLNNFIIPIAG